MQSSRLHSARPNSFLTRLDGSEGMSELFTFNLEALATTHKASQDC